MYAFAHEDLKVYALALDTARWVRSLSWPRGDAPLRDQARRASSSVVLNIAEGRSAEGGSRRHHYRIALASAAEVMAIFDLVDHPGITRHRDLLRQTGAMLSALIRR